MWPSSSETFHFVCFISRNIISRFFKKTHMGLHCLMVDLSLSKIFKIDEYNKSNFFSYLSLSFCCCRMFQWGSWCNFTVAVRPICQIVIVGRGSWISDPVDVTLRKLRSISSMAGYLSHEDRRVFVSDMNLAHITVS